MNGVLKLNETKIELDSLLVNCEINLMNLIRLWLDDKLLQYKCANDRLISLNKFV